MPLKDWALFKYLKPNGIYIIEELDSPDIFKVANPENDAMTLSKKLTKI